ncbi:MAG TPA: hypothetical protein VGJ04_08420 [Pirellulales bacterium]
MAKKKKGTIRKMVETVEGWVGMKPAKKKTKAKPKAGAKKKKAKKKSR